MIVVLSSAPAVAVAGALDRAAADQKANVVRDPAAAICSSYGFQTIYEMPEELQRSVRLRLIDEHCARLRAGGDQLFDHSVFGYVADWMRWFWGNTKTLDWEAVWSRAAECARMYDRIIHVEGNAVRPYDGYYWLDQANSTQIDRLLKSLYADFGVLERVTFEAANG